MEYQYDHVTHESLKPFVPQGCQILILGSLPSIATRAANFYYAHKTNRFYKALAGVFEEDEPLSIQERKEFLTRPAIRDNEIEIVYSPDYLEQILNNYKSNVVWRSIFRTEAVKKCEYDDGYICQDILYQVRISPYIKKAAYISPEWFPDFANYRRDGYDFDARFEDGLVCHGDKVLYDLIDKNAPVLSKRLKYLGNYRKGGNKGFDTIISRLQAQGYVIISDFRYMIDRNGNEYGWGVAEYSTPEHFMGEIFTGRVYERTPEESFERIFDHFRRILPFADENKIRKFLK